MWIMYYYLVVRWNILLDRKRHCLFNNLFVLSYGMDIDSNVISNGKSMTIMDHGGNHRLIYNCPGYYRITYKRTLSVLNEEWPCFYWPTYSLCTKICIYVCKKNRVYIKRGLHANITARHYDCHGSSILSRIPGTLTLTCTLIQAWISKFMSKKWGMKLHINSKT